MSDFGCVAACSDYASVHVFSSMSIVDWYRSDPLKHDFSGALSGKRFEPLSLVLLQVFAGFACFA